MIKPKQQKMVDWIKKGIITFIPIGLLIVGFVTYILKNSDANKVAKNYIRGNERIRASLGDIEGFGWFVTGQIEEMENSGYADLEFEINGTKKDSKIQIHLTKESSGWQVNSYELNK